jgi:uncharacterized phage protein gp47/JayE
MFAIPSLKDLMQRSRAAFRANLKGTDAWLWPNNVYVSAKVMAGMVFEVFGFADYIQRQKFATTADGDNLDLHGAEVGQTRRPAGPSRGFVQITVADGSYSVDAGDIFRRSDLVEYRATAGGSIPGPGTFSVEAIANTDGKNTISEPGTPLEIDGLSSNAITAAVGAKGIGGGSDLEDDETFRGRILFRKRNPPHGGSAADYVLWASEVSGVSAAADGTPRVWVEPLYSGPGTVRVFFMMDDTYVDGIPQPADVLRVADHIESVRPAGAFVAVAAPNPRVVNVQIANLVPDTTAVREAVVAELADCFRRRSRASGETIPKTNMPYLATPATFSLSWIWQAVANASGEKSHVITSPTADIVLIPGEIPVCGEVTFVTSEE